MKAKIEDTQIQDRVVNLLENKHQNKTKVLHFDLISVLLSELYN